MSEKKEYKLLESIRYSFLEWTAFVLLALFTVNPLVWLITGGKSWAYLYIHEYNRKVLLLGALILLVYFLKLRIDEKISPIRELLKKHIAMTLILTFGGLMIITTLLNGVPEWSIEGDYFCGEGLKGYLSYIIYFFLVAIMLSEKRKRLLSYVFLISSAVVGGAIFVDYIFFESARDYATRGGMILSNSNHLGYYLLMSIMFFGMLFVVESKKILKLVYLCAFMFMTSVLIMNDTWGCQLALFMGIIFTVIVYSVGKGKFQPRVLVLLVAMLLTFVLAYFSNDRLRENIDTNVVQQIQDMFAFVDDDKLDDETSGTIRIILWKYTWAYTLERPFIGHGADVTVDRLMVDAGNGRCHNDFLQYAVSFGIPATLVYIAAIFMVYLRGLKKKVHLTEMNYVGLCVAFTYLASSLVGNSMYYTAPFLFIALGMGYVRERKEN